MEELWKPLKGYEERYEISNHGNIRSLDFLDSWNRLRKGRIIKGAVDKAGYVRYRLSFQDKKKSFSAHRLVAIYFLENPENKPQVNHIDGDKTNNRVDNLEWCTNSENQIHSNSLGLRKHHSGERAISYKSAVSVYDIEGNFLYQLHGNKDMVDHGFEPRLVHKVCKGERKTHSGHIFRREKS